jgi:hypothetical protein
MLEHKRHDSLYHIIVKATKYDHPIMLNFTYDFVWQFNTVGLIILVHLFSFPEILHCYSNVFIRTGLHSQHWLGLLKDFICTRQTFYIEENYHCRINWPRSLNNNNAGQGSNLKGMFLYSHLKRLITLRFPNYLNRITFKWNIKCSLKELLCKLSWHLFRSLM